MKKEHIVLMILSAFAGLVTVVVIACATMKAAAAPECSLPAAAEAGKAYVECVARTEDRIGCMLAAVLVGGPDAFQCAREHMDSKCGSSCPFHLSDGGVP